MRQFAATSSACPRSSRPVGSAPPGAPCGRARPAPASVCFADLAWAINGVQHYMTTVTFPVVDISNNALFFVRCDSRRSTPGGCFPQRSLSATNRAQLCKTGDFAEPFPPPLRTLLWARRSSLWSRPARGCAPLDPRQGSPCTCPASPFMVKPGLCFSRNFALETQAEQTVIRLRSVTYGKKEPITFQYG